MKNILLPLFLLFAVRLPAEDIVFPPDAAINVTQAPYNAKGDGTTDDTAAIQKALDEGRHLIYLPNGTYRISSVLRWGKGQRHIVLQGQSRDGTILKLQDECPGFNLPDKPLPVIWTGKALAKQHFGNGLRNLTIDTGRGNPGAIGVQFTANLQGTVDTVRIRCGETGPAGLDLGYGSAQGPCLITHLEVIGFDRAIATTGSVNGLTFEDIHLQNQVSCGIHNDGQSLFIRGLQSLGGCTVLRNGGRESLAVLLDASLTGTARDADAVINGEKCALYLRKLKAEGFRAAVKNDGGDQQSPAGLQIEEWTSHPPVTLFPSPSRALGLPIKDAPDVPWDAPEDWISVGQFAPAKGEFTPPRGRPVRVEDWTQAIQQAIDSGKSTVYFPKEGMQFTGTVHVRGKVHRIIGCEQPSGRHTQGTWIIDDGDGPVIFERFDWSAGSVVIQNTSNRPLIASHLMGGEWQLGAGASETFFTDVSTGKIRIGAGARVWARQLHMDNRLETKIVNDGGILWILGLTTEGETTQIESRNGAQTELAGALVQVTTNKAKPPCFIVQDSTFSATMGESAYRRLPYQDLIVETRGPETKTLKNGDCPARAGGSLLTLFSAQP